MASLSPAGLAAMVIVLVALIKSSSAESNESNSSLPEEETIAFQTPAPPVANRRCYICGPRAQQPHRSRRPPTCQGFTEPGALVEDCDRGHNFCAFEITMNPYVESRLCVPRFDADCTTRICKTTNKTVITCSCQGDLCNGVKTDNVNRAVSAVIVASTSTRKQRQANTNAPPHMIGTITTITNGELPLSNATTIVPTIKAMTVDEHAKNHTKDNHIHHHEKDATQIMSDDPHSHSHDMSNAGKSTTNHVLHGTSFDYDEEIEDDEEGSGQATDSEHSSGKRQQDSKSKQAEADKRQGTSITTTVSPNSASIIQPFCYLVAWTVTAFNMY